MKRPITASDINKRNEASQKRWIKMQNKLLAPIIKQLEREIRKLVK